MDSVKLFKCLSDRSRLKIILELKEKASYVELLAEKLKLSPSTVSFHLKKLQELSLVSAKKDQYYTVYSLNSELLEKPVINFICSSELKDSKEDEKSEFEYRNKVIKSFFHYDKLKRIPVQMKKRNIVLAYIIRLFDYDKDYSEKEVNEKLKEIYYDHCALRRELVDAGFMYRINNTYKKLKES